MTHSPSPISVGTVKEKILSGLKEQAEINLGMSMTFTLFEWLKEAKDELLEEQPIEAPVNRITEINAEVNQMTINDDQGEVRECWNYLRLCLFCFSLSLHYFDYLFIILKNIIGNVLLLMYCI